MGVSAAVAYGRDGLVFPVEHDSCLQDTGNLVLHAVCCLRSTFKEAIMLQKKSDFIQNNLLYSMEETQTGSERHVGEESRNEMLIFLHMTRL